MDQIIEKVHVLHADSSNRCKMMKLCERGWKEREDWREKKGRNSQATHFSFPRKILRVPCGYFEHQRRAQFEGCVAEPLQTILAILPGSEWSCLLVRIVLQDAPSEVARIYTPLKLRVFADDITARAMGKIRKWLK